MMTEEGTCLCGTDGVPVGELMKCKTHLAGHTILGCQVCGGSVCRLFFRTDGEFTCEHCGSSWPMPANYANRYCPQCRHRCADENLLTAIFGPVKEGVVDGDHQDPQHAHS